jgi:Fe-S-cluster-containing hydrogenase component 2
MCEMICSLSHEGVLSPSLARISIVENRFRQEARFCIQCEDEPCAKVCPTGAITRGERGDLIVDEELCDGSGLCVEACPYGVMYVHPIRNVATKCDLCGGSPECTSVCLAGAIELKQFW